ncbi:MAG: molybdopterin-dependent oxidoreductase [Bacillota bacterium]
MSNEQSRKDFLKKMGAAGAIAVFGLSNAGKLVEAVTPSLNNEQELETELDENTRVVNTTCLGCDARCGVRVQTNDEQITRIQGNPYSPQNMGYEPLPYNTPVTESLKTAGQACLKGTSGAHYNYDPLRIVTPLKRNGPRGSDQWKPISWEQLIEEVVEGGELFSEIGENRYIEGFRKVRSTKLIDPQQPELGPKSNQLSMIYGGGGGQEPRPAFCKRWLRSYGSVNYSDHSDICQLPWYFGQLYGTDFKTDNCRPDYDSTRFVLAMGITIFEGAKPGLLGVTSRVVERVNKGDLKVVYVNPKAPKTQSAKWVPIRPGRDVSLVMGMIQWIIANKRYDQKFLENTSKQAAEKDGEHCWTASTYLVAPELRRYLRAKDLGIGEDQYVVVDPVAMELTTHDKVDTGALEYKGTVIVDGKEVLVKTGFQVLKDLANENTPEGWAKQCDVPLETIIELAREFTCYGKQAATDSYRGMDQANGSYMNWAIFMLNSLIGNLGVKGGLLKTAGGFNYIAGKYDLAMVKDAPSGGGVRIDRNEFNYEDTSLYKMKVAKGENPYPAKLPWFPLTKGRGSYTQALMGIDQQYPYPVKIVLSYFMDAIGNVAGGQRYLETFKSLEKIPLHIAVMTQYGEQIRYADYIVPDYTYLDGQYYTGGYHWSPMKATPIRTPVVESATKGICFEKFMIDVAKALDMPGYGSNAVNIKDGGVARLESSDDFAAYACANLAINEKLPEAKPEEVAFVEKNYPCSQRFKEVLSPSDWKRVCYLLARGGIFEPKESIFNEKGHHKHTPSLMLVFYNEKLANTINAATGKPYHDLPRQQLMGRDFYDRSLDQLAGDQYAFNLVSPRHSGMAFARSQNFYWMTEIMPENFVEINIEDAKALNINDGDSVKVSSPYLQEGSIGKAKVSNLISRGVVFIYHSWGRYNSPGSREWFVKDGADKAVQGFPLGKERSNILFGPELVKNGVAEGEKVKADARRGKGISGNELGSVWEWDGKTIISSDIVSGGGNYYYHKVSIEKVK